ncbi:MAG: GNAT family N-acetyltransferase [Candidatus Dormibacter sp.]|uniref:GNAT family N-acetyltransferase n=1 Tax=Candidatus Dormibacter sp. TaxID=2973982 RepID=UPI000DB4FB36|nr:MAG: GNAT family N-acetyltransferase [Candidatus Dormibacteraeota bacterium]
MSGVPHFEIRHAQPGDEEAIARVHVASWQSAYAGLLPAGYLDALDWRRRAEQWGEWLRQPPAGSMALTAHSTAGLIGFASLGPSRDVAERDHYELYAIYVLPQAWRSGAGSALLTAGLSGLTGQAERVGLWVLRDKLRALGFYERRSFETDGATKAISLGGRDLVELRYVKRL